VNITLSDSYTRQHPRSQPHFLTPRLTALALVRQLAGRRVGFDRYLVKCPCHDDRVASLSIRQCGDKVLLYCFAGCDTRDILAKLNLSFADLGGGHPQLVLRPSRPRVVNWDDELRKKIRELARAVVEGPLEPETHEQRLKQMYREAAWAFRWLNQRIDAHPEWISLVSEHERALTELHVELIALKEGRHG
jgi:hypothetical protein